MSTDNDNLLGTGNGAIITSCDTSEIGVNPLLTTLSSPTNCLATDPFLVSALLECPDNNFIFAENLESRLVMPVELVLPGGDCLALLPLASPLVVDETSGVSSKTPLSSDMTEGRLLGERTTTVGWTEGRMKDMETFFANSFASSALLI